MGLWIVEGWRRISFVFMLFFIFFFFFNMVMVVVRLGVIEKEKKK